MVIFLNWTIFAKYQSIVVPNKKGRVNKKFREEYKGKHLRSQEFFHKVNRF